tara:strand:+ start:425 stop:1426 length:1002 start_codon:yes stop_codon:yes gene_type:complete
MNKIVIIILFIIIIFFLLTKKKNTQQVFIENEIIEDSIPNSLQSNFVKPNNKIYHLFNKASKEISNKNKISLSGNSIESMYTKATIQEDLLTYSKILISSIIKKTVKLTNNIDYYVKEIVELYQQVDTNGNQRYIVKCFIFDIKNFYEIKILLDFLVIQDDMYINYVGEDLSSNLNIINKYDYKLSNTGYLTNRNNIKDNIKSIVESYYRQYYNIIGYDASSFEYSHYISKLDTVYKYNIKDLVKNYLPPDIPTLYDERFGEKNSEKWDENGIKLLKNENVMINNNSTNLQPNIPLDFPGSGPKQYPYDGTYDYLQNVGYNSGGIVVTNSGYY